MIKHSVSLGVERLTFKHDVSRGDCLPAAQLFREFERDLCRQRLASFLSADGRAVRRFNSHQGAPGANYI
jgi:hypothetical protein